MRRAFSGSAQTTVRYESLPRDLLGVRRPGHQPDLPIRQPVMVVDVLHDGLIVARDDALDGRNDEFVTERNGQRGEEILEVGRRRGEDHDVGVAHHGVEVGRGGDAVAVELQIVQIAGVAAVRAQRFEHLGIADIPPYAPAVGCKQSDDGRRPASIADDRTAGVGSDFVFHAEIQFFQHKCN